MMSFIGKRNLIKVKAVWTLMYADERRHLQMESAYVSVRQRPKCAFRGENQYLGMHRSHARVIERGDFGAGN
jgi:hypothetical protein